MSATVSLDPHPSPLAPLASGDGEFARAVASAIDLLRTLPRSPRDVELAREELSRFAGAYPSASPEFFIDLAPGAEHADFDLYLAHPAGGTVGITFREDAGRPWFVDYSEHHAANYVLHVGKLHVSVQEAMFAVQYLAEREHGLLDDLVRDTLLSEAVTSDASVWAGDALDVSPDEVQRASDAFRYANNLESSADTAAFLERVGWSVHRFQSMLASGVRLRKMEELLVGAQIPEHFASHTSDFDLLRVFRAECDSRDAAEELARAARRIGLMAAVQSVASESTDVLVNGAIVTARAWELRSELAPSDSGDVIGPTQTGDRFVIVHVLRRDPARTLDAPTRRAVRERLVREWLTERARHVPVRWNWN